MRLPWLAGCAIIAILPLLWLPALPGSGILAVAGVLAMLLTRLRGTVVAVVAVTLLLMVWGVLSAYQALWPTQHLTGAVRQAEVILHETDGQTLHRGQIVRLAGRFLFPPVGVTLYGELAPAPVCEGQRWMMTLRLRPVHGQLNDGGFDSQRYALAQHRPLSGGIVAASALDTRCSLRARYLASLTRRLQTYPWHPVMLGLGMGERLALPAEIKVLMQNTGTSHLMAISGLHIALAASLIVLLLRGLQSLLPGRWIGWRLPLLAGLAGAVGYAWLTGMQPPALRTCVGLAVCCALRLSGQRWTAWQVWLCCLGAILVADPLAVLSQSLWLSAFAVAGLIFWYQWLPLPDSRWRWPWKALFARAFAGWRDAAADAAATAALPRYKPDIDGRQFAGGTVSDPAGGAAHSRRNAAASHWTGDGGVADLAGSRSRAGGVVLGVTTFTGRLADVGCPLALDQ